MKILLSIQYPKELRIPSHLTLYEKWKLKDLARLTTGKVFVEIGFYLGASACFISAGLKQAWAWSRVKLYRIDIWQNDMMSEGRRDTFDIFSDKTASYSDIMVPPRGYSSEVNQWFSTCIDFLFINGGHSFEAVPTNLQAWFPKLNEKALVIFHDIG